MIKSLLGQERFEHLDKDILKELIKPIAKKYGATTGQLALAWVFSQPGVCAIAGARDVNQVLMNAKSATLKISNTDLDHINEIGIIVTGHLDERPVMWQW